MLVLTAKQQRDRHVNAREGMTKHFNKEMEKVLNANKDKELYWILGKVKAVKKGSATVLRPYLEASMEKPGIVKESFVYEVDNKRGTKTLLWVMHPGDALSFPTLGKTIRVGGTQPAVNTNLIV